MMIWKKRGRKKTENEFTIRLDREDLVNLVNETVLTGQSSIVGTRHEQQDSMFSNFYFDKHYAIGIVCDGMGGLKGGDIASKIAVEYIKEEVYKDIDLPDFERRIFEIIKKADMLVYNLEDDLGNPLHAGTTMVIVIIKDNYLQWISVGDSKIYLYKKNKLICLTNEHNYRFMATQRKNDPSFRYDPKARQDALVSYLGAGSLKYVDTNNELVRLESNDMVLLCSDGLYKAINEGAITEIIKQNDIHPCEIAQSLTTMALVNTKGSQDNTTVVVLKYKDE